MSKEQAALLARRRTEALIARYLRELAGGSTKGQMRVA
jgi:hypothetical protein